MAANMLSDGGGKTFIQTGEKMKCSNVQRSFINEDTCFLSTKSMVCSASQPVGEVTIPRNTSNVIAFYDLAGKYFYAIRSLVMENLDEHVCVKTPSRQEVNLNGTCSAPTQLEVNTIAAFENAVTSISGLNKFTKDFTCTLACNSTDETIGKINIQIQVDSDCYTHVHPNYLNVYDFSG